MNNEDLIYKKTAEGTEYRVDHGLTHGSQEVYIVKYYCESCKKTRETPCFYDEGHSHGWRLPTREEFINHIKNSHNECGDCINEKRLMYN